MNKKVITSLLALTALPFASGLFGQAYTTPVGAVAVTVPAGTVALSIPFVKAISYQSALTGAGANTLTVSGQDFSAYDGGSFYAEILSGGFEGNIVNIVSASGDTLTVDGDVSALTGAEIIAIREHTTLSDILPANTLAAYSDTVTIFNSDGSIVSLLDDGMGGWADSGTFMPASDPIVHPGQAVLINSSGFQVSLLGSVKVGPTVVPLTANVPNLVGTLNPVADISLADSNVASVMGPYSDTVSVISEDGALTLVSALSDGMGGFVDPSDFVTPVNASIPSAGAVLLQPAMSADWVLPSVYTNP